MPSGLMQLKAMGIRKSILLLIDGLLGSQFDFCPRIEAFF
jgi:hypothetical protein